MRILDARVHGLLDLALVVIFLLAPLVYGLGGSPAAKAAEKRSRANAWPT